MMICTLSLTALILTAAAGEVEWDLPSLTAPPRVWAATQQAEGVRGLFYEGLPHEGTGTRVFAWLGMPEVPEGETVPGVVLVHGGGGTAFAHWVRLWTERGYAAIAMDLCGRTGIDTEGRNNLEYPRHPWAGPDHYGKPGAMAEDPRQDWVYHAVANIILANSLLRAQSGVDAERVGLTGISWGGFFSCIVPAVDERFAFSIPVYGASWQGKWPIREDSPWAGSQAWLDRWDALNFIPGIRCPMLWVNGASDPHFPLRTHTPSYRAARTDARLTLLPGFGHSHTHGWQPVEIYAFADTQVKEGKEDETKDAAPLARVGRHGVAGSLVGVEYVSAVPIREATLYVSPDITDDAAVVWTAHPARIDAERALITATLPANAAAWFVNLVDARDLTVSTSCHFATEAQQ